MKWNKIDDRYISEDDKWAIEKGYALVIHYNSGPGLRRNGWILTRLDSGESQYDIKTLKRAKQIAEAS